MEEKGLPKRCVRGTRIKSNHLRVTGKVGLD